MRILYQMSIDNKYKKQSLYMYQISKMAKLALDVSTYTFGVNNNHIYELDNNYNIFHIIRRPLRRMGYYKKNTRPFRLTPKFSPSLFKFISDYMDDPYYWRQMFL